MNSKICSVIVPIYNAAPYLAQCLSSIRMQTYTDLQVILVDDDSTDESPAIAQSFVDADQRFVLYHQAHQGQSVARNMAMEKATGAYLVFVDADDYLDLDFVEQHTAALGKADYVQSGYRRVSADGDILMQKLPVHRYQFTSPCMRLYRLDWIKQHHFSFPVNMIYEDVVFSLLLWNTHPQVRMLQHKAYNYTFNPTSTTAITNRDAQHNLYRAIWALPISRWLKIYTSLRLLIHYSIV